VVFAEVTERKIPLFLPNFRFRYRKQVIKKYMMQA